MRAQKLHSSEHPETRMDAGVTPAYLKQGKVVFMSLLYDIRAKALDGVSDQSVKNYKAWTAYFCDFARDQGITKTKQLGSLDDKKALINAYVEKLSSEGKSPATIHSYISPICKAFDIKSPGKGRPWEGIEKPERTAKSISKGRMPDLVNPRAQKDLNNPKYARVVSGAEILGIRRGEFSKVTYIRLEKDVCGYDCAVIKGKGGKIQHQRIMPEDLQRMKELAAGHTGKQRIFSDEELKNKINLHAFRREHAQKLYYHYVDQIQKGKSDQLRDELRATWKEYHPQNRPKQDAEAWRQFEKDLTGYQGEYKLRGGNADRARQAGLSPVLNRLAVMCVSVFHLAHWRPDVTVTNYMM